jgi:hypothetical protein
MNTFLVFAKPADNAANAEGGQARRLRAYLSFRRTLRRREKCPARAARKLQPSAVAIYGPSGWLDIWELPMNRIWIAALALAPMIAAAPVKAQVSPEELRKCTFVEDMTRERLDCFDKLIRPEAIQVLQQAAPRTIYDCRYIKEQDARLKCFNRFATQAPAPVQRAAPKPKAQ